MGIQDLWKLFTEKRGKSVTSLCEFGGHQFKDIVGSCDDYKGRGIAIDAPFFVMKVFQYEWSKQFMDGLKLTQEKSFQKVKLSICAMHRSLKMRDVSVIWCWDGEWNDQKIAKERRKKQRESSIRNLDDAKRNYLAMYQMYKRIYKKIKGKKSKLATILDFTESDDGSGEPCENKDGVPIDYVIDLKGQDIQDMKEQFCQFLEPKKAKAVLDEDYPEDDLLQVCQELVDMMACEFQKKLKNNPVFPRNMFQDLRVFMDEYGIQYAYKPSESEGERLAAKLVHQGEAAAVFSTDTDLIAFGVPMITSIDTKTGMIKWNDYREFIEALRATNIEFKRDPMITLRGICVMLGCDFNTRIPKVGPVSILSLFRTHKTVEDASGRHEKRDLLNIDACMEFFAIEEAPVIREKYIHREDEAAAKAKFSEDPRDPYAVALTCKFLASHPVAEEFAEVTFE